MIEWIKYWPFLDGPIRKKSKNASDKQNSVPLVSFSFYKFDLKILLTVGLFVYFMLSRYMISQTDWSS